LCSFPSRQHPRHGGHVESRASGRGISRQL
jgi:hypothetical protein